MKFYKISDRKRFIIGLILIIILYSSYYILFAENPNSASIPRRIRHIIKFGITVLVYIIGSIHLGKLKAQWMQSIWHLFHVSGLLVIIIVGLYDWLIGESTLRIKLFAQGVQEMLISPLLYIGMGLLDKVLNR